MTTRNRRAAALTLACLCAALLAGCNNKSPEAGRPNTAPPPSTSSPKDTSAPSPSGSIAPTAAPSRPSVASGSSLAAAEAFLAYYIDLLNYSSETGDPEPFLIESDKGCVGCKGIADYTRKINVKNGGLKGDFKDQLVSVKEISHGQEGRLFGSATVRTGTYEERVTPGASPVPQPASTGTMEFTLAANAGNWVMYEMQINE